MLVACNVDAQVTTTKTTTRATTTTTAATTTTTKTTTAATTTTAKTTTSTSTTTKTAAATSTDKVITSWKKSTGTNWNITNNVMNVWYNATYVWVYAHSIPSYSIGPWKSNPNSPKAQNKTYYFKRTPTATSSKTANSLGAIGIWLDGVAIYNGYDGMSFNNLSVWQRNAYVWEGISFDGCNGHPDGSGSYHIHVAPICLYNTSSTAHSPLLGYIFDSYPIYGPYGYSSANNSGSTVKRLQSSYWARNITTRDTLANGTTLTPYYTGPPVNSTYPIGSYLQDYKYVSGYGDLDEYNGRWCVTPEYPNGTYAYFVTTNSSGSLAYPYLVGPSYYGTYLGQNSVSVSSTATKYF